MGATACGYLSAGHLGHDEKLAIDGDRERWKRCAGQFFERRTRKAGLEIERAQRLEHIRHGHGRAALGESMTDLPGIGSDLVQSRHQYHGGRAGIVQGFAVLVTGHCTLLRRQNFPVRRNGKLRRCDRTQCSHRIPRLYCSMAM